MTKNYRISVLENTCKLIRAFLPQTRQQLKDLAYAEVGWPYLAFFNKFLEHHNGRNAKLRKRDGVRLNVEIRHQEVVSVVDGCVLKRKRLNRNSDATLANNIMYCISNCRFVCIFSRIKTAQYHQSLADRFLRKVESRFAFLRSAIQSDAP